jgi:hypothetical protein
VILGVAADAIHPLGAVCAVLTTSLFLVLIAALGTTMSLLSVSSVRSIAMTIVAILTFNGNLVICCFGVPIAPMALGITPAMLWLCLGSEGEFGWFLVKRDSQGLPQNEPIVATMLVGFVCYGLATIGLTTYSLFRFKVAADRPRRLLKAAAALPIARARAG